MRAPSAAAALTAMAAKTPSLRRLLRDEGGHPALRGLLVRQDAESIVPEDEPADGAPLGIA
jgi:hypothetical protein